MIEKYLIADFVFEINYNGDSVVKDKLSAYKDDSVRASSDFKISIEYSSESIKVKTENITKVSEGLYFYTTKNSDVLFYYDVNISKVIAKIEFSLDYENVNVVLYELHKNHGVEDSQLTYNVLGTIFSYIVQMHGGFVFHSSSVCYNNCGVAFSAKSGTGKSTHTKLWLRQFEDCFVLNDDTPVIHFGTDDKFYISGTPWAGTTGINRNVNVPLKAIVFLERSAENYMEQISASDAMNFMFEGIRTPLTVRMLTHIIDSFNKLFAGVPVYKLKCNMDPSAAFLSQKTIFGNDEI